MENKNYVICPICNLKFKSLISHVAKGHKISISELLIKYPGTIINSAESIKKLVKSCTGRILSEKTKQKLSELLSGENNPFYGKKHTDETKQLMSENHADFNGDKNPLVIWLKESEENIIKYKEIH